MADDADLNWTSEIAHFPALGQWLRGRRRDGSGCRGHIEFLFELQSQPLNSSARCFRQKRVMLDSETITPYCASKS